MRQASYNQSRESGAVLGFIIVTLVLLGLLAGGLWFIKNRSDAVAKVDTVSQNVKEEAKKATDSNKQDAPKPTTDTSAGSSANSGNTGSTNKPAPTPAPAATPAPSAPKPAPVTPAPTASTSRPSSVATTGPSHIATTGPADVFANAFLFAGLVIAGYLYRESRRHAA